MLRVAPRKFSDSFVDIRGAAFGQRGKIHQCSPGPVTSGIGFSGPAHARTSCTPFDVGSRSSQVAELLAPSRSSLPSVSSSCAKRCRHESEKWTPASIACARGPRLGQAGIAVQGTRGIALPTANSQLFAFLGLNRHTCGRPTRNKWVALFADLTAAVWRLPIDRFFALATFVAN